ncbi:hypothetical protein ABMC89_02200 [Sulfitobacter sp. HNIBRBA3233]|uniref:hypothetical protein n=1 Tax=Sulfitobacter marinivivus TaxID=3158558 RepID=UPI0032DF497B
MEQTHHRPTAKFGLFGVLLGMVSIFILMVQMSAFFGSSEKSAGTSVGEIAAEIKMSALRKLSGEPAPPAPPAPSDYTQELLIAALALAAIAAVLGAIGLYRHEPRQLALMAMGIGLSAFVLQYAFWLAILACGVMLLAAILYNLDSILS